MHYNYLLFLHKNILSACIISVSGTHQMIIINDKGLKNVREMASFAYISLGNFEFRKHFMYCDLVKILYFTYILASSGFQFLKLKKKSCF